MAKGEIIVVHDSDDVSEKNRLKLIANLYGHKKFDVGYSGWYITDEKLYVKEVRAAMPFDFKRLKEAQYIASPTLFYTKKLAMQVPYRNKLKVANDWQFLIDCAWKKKRFERINKQLVKYRMHGECTSIVHRDEVNVYDNKMKAKGWRG